MFTEPYNSPGRWGVNLQEKDELLHPNWATVADGLVLNNTNQLRCIGGFTRVSTTDAASAIQRGFVYKDADGDEILLTSQATRIVAGTNVDLTAAGNDVTSATTPTNGYWQFVNFNGKVLGWQAGEAPIVKTTGDFADIVASAGTLPDGDAVCAAYGRVWAVDDDRQTVRYSALLDETDYSTASGGGAIDMRNVWTLGIDYVTAIAAFNGALVIFGRNHIVIYVDSQGSDVGVDPDNLAVSDVIAGTGCVARDTVKMIGDGDIMFLSPHGLQSLGRLLVQKDNPLTTVSWQVRDDLTALIRTELQAQAAAKNDVRAFNAEYMPEFGQYWLLYGDATARQAYVFHLNAKAQDDQGREVVPVTKQTVNAAYVAFGYNWMAVSQDGTVYMSSGLNDDVCTYSMTDETTADAGALLANYESGWIKEEQPEIRGRVKVLTALESIVRNPGARSSANTIQFTNDYDTTLDSITGLAKSATLLTEVFDGMGETEGRVFKLGLTNTDFGRRVIQSIAPTYTVGKHMQLHENADNYTVSDDLEDAGVSTIPYFADFGGSPLTFESYGALPTVSSGAPVSTDFDLQFPALSNIDGFVIAAVVTSSSFSDRSFSVDVGSSTGIATLIGCTAATGNTFRNGHIGYVPLDGVSAADLAAGIVTLVGNTSPAAAMRMDVKIYPVVNGGTGAATQTDEWGLVAGQNLGSNAVLDDISLATTRNNSQMVVAATVSGGSALSDDLLEANNDPTNFPFVDLLGGQPNGSSLATMFVYLAPCVPATSTTLSPDVTFSLRTGNVAGGASVNAFEVPA